MFDPAIVIVQELNQQEQLSPKEIQKAVTDIFDVIKNSASHDEQTSLQLFSLQNLGEDARPYVLKGLRDKNPQVRALAATFAGTLHTIDEKDKGPLRALYNDPNAHVRVCAIQAILSSGVTKRDSKSLIRALTNTNDDVRGFATTGIRILGEAAKEQILILQKNLTSNNIKERQIAAESLMELGEIAHNIVGDHLIDSLMKGLRKSDETIAIHCQMALFRIGPPAITALSSGLKNHNTLVRGRSIEVLGRLQNVPTSIRAEYDNFLADNSSFVRIKASDAISRNQDDYSSQELSLITRKILLIHEEVSADEKKDLLDPLVRMQQGRQLIFHAISSEALVQSEENQAQYHNALFILGAENSTQLNRLYELLEEHPSTLKNALRTITPKAELLEKYIKGIDHESLGVRLYALKAIEKLEVGGRGASSKIIPLLQSQDDVIRKAAKNTLNSLKDPETIPLLIKNLSSTNEEVVASSISILERIGEPAQSALPKLLELRGVGDTDVGLAARSAIVTLAEPQSKDLEQIAILLDHENADVRYNSVFVIGNGGKNATKYLSKLQELEKSDPDSYVQRASETAIKKLRVYTEKE